MLLEAVERLGQHGRSLTISSIVTEAGLSRSSFYTQFRDIGDIAVQLIDEVYRDIIPLDERIRAAGTGREATLAALEILTREMHARRHLFTAALGAVATARQHRMVWRIMAQAALPAIRKTAPAGIDHEAAAAFVAAGVLAALVYWLQSDPDRPAHEVQQEIVALLPPWLAADHPA